MKIGALAARSIVALPIVAIAIGAASCGGDGNSGGGGGSSEPAVAIVISRTPQGIGVNAIPIDTKNPGDLKVKVAGMSVPHDTRTSNPPMFQADLPMSDAALTPGASVMIRVDHARHGVVEFPIVVPEAPAITTEPSIAEWAWNVLDADDRNDGLRGSWAAAPNVNHAWGSVFGGMVPPGSKPVPSTRGAYQNGMLVFDLSPSNPSWVETKKGLLELGWGEVVVSVERLSEPHWPDGAFVRAQFIGGQGGGATSLMNMEGTWDISATYTATNERFSVTVGNDDAIVPITRGDKHWAAPGKDTTVEIAGRILTIKGQILTGPVPNPSSAGGVQVFTATLTSSRSITGGVSGTVAAQQSSQSAAQLSAITSGRFVMNRR
jgi:hypothetical protein